MSTPDRSNSEWDPSREVRDDISGRAAAGISSMCHARGQHVDDSDAQAAASEAEQRAYDRARIESKTTTGSRPRAEVERAYLRILSQKVSEIVKNGGKYNQNEQTDVSGESLDLSSTGREFVSEALAKKLLKPLLDPGSKIKSMKLSTKSIGLDSVTVVADAIRNVASSLERADISDIIAGRPEKEVLQVLQMVSSALAECSSLLHVNISDNALGEKGIRACGDVLSRTACLEGLYLQNIGCSVNACKAVAELVKCDSLKLLHLFNNMSDNAGAEHIASLLARNSQMQDFKMVSSRVGSKGGAALCSALAGGTSLTSFDISDNPMDADIAPHIASLASKHCGLQRLILSDLGLGDEGVEVVCQALAGANVCPSLEKIELALNEITRESTPSVAAMLVARKSSLRHVGLAENELECAGAIHVATALQGAPKLEVLDLQTNSIARVGALAVAKACSQGMKALKVVELDDNKIPDDGVDKVMDLLQDKLGRLDQNCAEDGSDQDEGLFEEAQAELENLDIDLGQLAL
eukprot:jgi/Ulvmu1/9794/UM056_0034.1